jgi:hypothetical protein
VLIFSTHKWCNGEHVDPKLLNLLFAALPLSTLHYEVSAKTG